MFSLAIIASLTFIVVFLIGPVSYLLSKIPYIPTWIIYFLAITNIAIGLWWLLLPLPNIRYIGLIDIVIGWKLCNAGDKKK
jgi:hypothetical protein